jgi:hypothetical protein
MSDLCRLIWCAMVGLVSSRAALQAEILILRHQLNVLRRKSPKPVAFGNIDQLLFVGLYLWGANTGPGSIRRVYSIDKSPARRSCWKEGGGGVRCCGCWS